MIEDNDKFVNNNIDFISFKELVEQITGASFQEIYKGFLTCGETHAEIGQKESNLE